MAKKVIVVGAGIVGVSCAAYLLRDGHDVTLIDREGPAAGASQGNAGALSPGSCVPLAMPGVIAKTPSWLLDREGPLVVRPSYLLQALPWLIRFVATARPAMVERSADALRALHSRVYEDYGPLVEAASAQNLIRRSGTMVVFSSDGSFESSRGDWEMRTRRGAEVQVLDAPEIRQIEPTLSERYRRAVLLPEHGYAADPRALVTRIAAWFSDNGGRFEKAAATAVESHKGRPVVTLASGGKIEADEVVLAAGAWSGELLARAGIRVPLETQRGYHVTLSKPNIELRRPITLAEDKVYVTPMLGGLRAAGTVEFAGLTARPNWERARRLVGIARKALPQLSYTGSSEWMGHRPCLPDSLPAIGPIAKLPGVYAAFGHGHNGMTSGPVTGRLIADLIARRTPPIDMTPYRFERLH